MYPFAKIIRSVPLVLCFIVFSLNSALADYPNDDLFSFDNKVEKDSEFLGAQDERDHKPKSDTVKESTDLGDQDIAESMQIKPRQWHKEKSFSGNIAPQLGLHSSKTRVCVTLDDYNGAMANGGHNFIQYGVHTETFETLEELIACIKNAKEGTENLVINAHGEPNIIGPLWVDEKDNIRKVAEMVRKRKIKHVAFMSCRTGRYADSSDSLPAVFSRLSGADVTSYSHSVINALGRSYVPEGTIAHTWFSGESGRNVNWIGVVEGDGSFSKEEEEEYWVRKEVLDKVVEKAAKREDEYKKWAKDVANEYKKSHDDVVKWAEDIRDKYKKQIDELKNRKDRYRRHRPYYPKYGHGSQYAGGLGGSHGGGGGAGGVGGRRRPIAPLKPRKIPEPGPMPPGVDFASLKVPQPNAFPALFNSGYGSVPPGASFNSPFNSGMDAIKTALIENNREYFESVKAAEAQKKLNRKSLFSDGGTSGLDMASKLRAMPPPGESPRLLAPRSTPKALFGSNL